MATNFRVKMGEIDRLTFISALAFLNGVEYHIFDYMSSSAMIWLHCVKFDELRSSNSEV